MQYSLSNYILTIKLPEKLSSEFGTSIISVGGEGSYLDKIEVKINKSQWNTTGDATGSWVHEKSLDRTGTCDISINMMSDKVSRFITLCNFYYGSDYDGLTLEISDNEGDTVVTCDDCLLTAIPSLVLQSSSQTQNWSFTCGRITFH